MGNDYIVELFVGWYEFYLRLMPFLNYFGIASVFWLFWFNSKKDSKLHKASLFISALSLLSPIIILSTWFVFFILADMSLLDDRFFASKFFLRWLECFAGGFALSIAWYRYVEPRANVTLAKWKRSSDLERNKKTDVRNIKDFLPKAQQFDPLKYINLTKGIFLGLDEKREPTYIKFPTGTSAPHVQVCGTTGAGKGVSLGVMSSQFLERGEAVFFMDPKNDEWAPHVLYESAKRTRKPFYFINLNRPNGPQFNIFEGATEDDAFELFQAGLSLTDKGDSSDFYGIADRKEAGRIAKLMAEKNLNIAQVYSESLGTIQAEKFEGRLRELAETPSINALPGEGVELAQVIDQGGCVYVVGSMRNDIVKTVQRILLVRLLQLAERRDRIKGDIRPICIVLDEVKYHLSRPALEGLGAARDKGVHLMLAHQSKGDLRDCAKDLNPDAVVDAVVENTKIKAVYQVMSPDTAEWFATMSGEIQVDDESRKVTRNIAQSEIVDAERSIRQASRYFIDANMLLNLPPSVCVLYGDGLPKFVTIKPLRVKKSEEAIRIALVDGTSAPTAEQAIDVDAHEKPFKSDAAKAIADLENFTEE